MLHIGLKEDGTIQVGNKTKAGKWSSTVNATDEALCAVRDHLLIATQKENKPMCYAWNYPNGKTLILKLEEKDTEAIKE